MIGEVKIENGDWFSGIIRGERASRIDVYAINCRCAVSNLETHDPDLRGALAERRVQQALDVGAQWLVSACQQCKRTLASGVRSLAKKGTRARLRVVDLVELVESQLVQG